MSWRSRRSCRRVVDRAGHIGESICLDPGGAAMRRTLTVSVVAATLALSGLMFAQTSQAAAVTITSGTAWTDTAGSPLQAHGEGIFKVGSTYYMVGEDKT